MISLIVRVYKDRLFRFVYKDKKFLLELYNSLNNSYYTDPEALIINTIEDVIYMGMKNDMSFIIDCRLNLYEHQSTINPNMPIRGLLYFSELYKVLLSTANLFSSKLIKLPTPNYIVFYNGDKEIDDKTILKLSDAFETPTNDPCLECKATVLNINEGHNSELMAKCRSLYGYASFVAKERKYSAEMDIEAAINKAIDESIAENNPIKEILSKNRAEVLDLILTEYDEEKVLADLSRESFEEGLAIGEAKGKAEGKAEGEAKGKAEGKAEGEAKGKAEGKAELIRQLISGGFPIVDIKRATGLTDKEIHEMTEY